MSRLSLSSPTGILPLARPKLTLVVRAPLTPYVICGNELDDTFAKTIPQVSDDIVSGAGATGDSGDVPAQADGETKVRSPITISRVPSLMMPLGHLPECVRNSGHPLFIVYHHYTSS